MTDKRTGAFAGMRLGRESWNTCFSTTSSTANPTGCKHSQPNKVYRVPGPDSTVYPVSCTATTMCLHIGWYVDELTCLVWLTCVVRIGEEWLNTNIVIFNSILQPSTQVDTLAVVGSTGHLEPYISFWLVMICYQMLKSFFNLIATVKRTKIINT